MTLPKPRWMVLTRDWKKNIPLQLVWGRNSGLRIIRLSDQRGEGPSTSSEEIVAPGGNSPPPTRSLRIASRIGTILTESTRAGRRRRVSDRHARSAAEVPDEFADANPQKRSAAINTLPLTKRATLAESSRDILLWSFPLNSRFGAPPRADVSRLFQLQRGLAPLYAAIDHEVRARPVVGGIGSGEDRLLRNILLLLDSRCACERDSAEGAWDGSNPNQTAS